jgi:hypothetical protein
LIFSRSSCRLDRLAWLLLRVQLLPSLFQLLVWWHRSLLRWHHMIFCGSFSLQE